MQTLRGRLTASYSAALALTLAAFAVLLYLDRRSASYQDLDQRIQSEATLTAGILAESYRSDGPRGGLRPAEPAPPFRGTRPPGAGGPLARGLRAPRRAPGAGGRVHPEAPGDPGRPQPPPPARRADGEGRAGAAGGDAEPDDEPPGAELRGAAALHRRREPRAEDAAYRAARGRRAGHHHPEHASGHARRAGGDAAGDQTDDGAGDALLPLARADEGAAPLPPPPLGPRTLIQEAPEAGEAPAEQAGGEEDAGAAPDP